jgi:uncharacterized membrane protein YtjA (UPF0391 family)
MLNVSITFFVIALMAYMLGAFGLAGLSLEIGKMLLTVFLILSVVSFVLSLFTPKKTTRTSL